MNRFRLKGFLKEFPWLGKVLELVRVIEFDLINEIVVRRIDSHFLRDGLVGRDDYTENDDESFEDRLFAVFNDGVVEVSHQGSVARRPAFSYQESVWLHSEPVIEALGGYEDAQYLVLVGHVARSSRYGYWGIRIKIYKAPKHTTLRAEIERYRAEHENRVRAESDL